MRANRLLLGHAGRSYAPLVAVVLAMMTLVAVRMQLADAHQYAVRPGDTLSDVADRLGVSVEALAVANGIDDPDFIVEGQILVVPNDGGSSTEYLVKDGETLAGISERVGVPVKDLMAANGLTNANFVQAGKLLAVPPIGSAVVAGPVTAAGGGSYTVREGDSLTYVASRLGVSVNELVAANGITNANLIIPGQVITVPNAWLCPVPSGTFVNDYGYMRDDGGKHNGIDLFAVKGAPIQAPVGGTIERFPNPSGGQAIRLYGNDGNRYYFAHLSDYGEGGTVSAGEIVGYVGNTGDAVATSPHLHFEIRPGGGEAINPFPTLVAACL